MTENLAMAMEFFLAHSVVICIILAVVLVVSSIVFLKKLSKSGKKTIEKKNEDKPELDPLEKMYLEELKR